MALSSKKIEGNRAIILEMNKLKNNLPNSEYDNSEKQALMSAADELIQLCTEEGSSGEDLPTDREKKRLGLISEIERITTNRKSLGQYTELSMQKVETDTENITKAAELEQVIVDKFSSKNISRAFPKAVREILKAKNNNYSDPRKLREQVDRVLKRINEEFEEDSNNLLKTVNNASICITEAINLFDSALNSGTPKTLRVNIPNFEEFLLELLFEGRSRVTVNDSETTVKNKTKTLFQDKIVV